MDQLAYQKPLQTILVKPAGRDCNMACAYCFTRENPALSDGPSGARMPEKILARLIQQGMRQAGRDVSFTWQGGEPLLMGLPFYQKVIELQMEYGSGQTIGNGLQTNGLLIDDDWVNFFKSTNWLVGLSIDGPRHVHDHYRRTTKAEGTWRTVMKSAEKLLNAGVAVNALSVVNDYSAGFARQIYEAHKAMGLNYMQFIPCVETLPSGMHPTSVPPKAFGKFLCTLFDLWTEDFKDGVPTTSVRFFDSLLWHYLGHARPECEGTAECGTYIVVDHNGDVYACDFYVEPRWRLGNLAHDALITMLNGDRQTAFGRQKADLPQVCTACKWLDQCHGGCTKDRLAGREPSKSNYLCESYQTFFGYADLKFQALAEHLRKRQDEESISNAGK